jgi:hypothetical protein
LASYSRGESGQTSQRQKADGCLLSASSRLRGAGNRVRTDDLKLGKANHGADSPGEIAELLCAPRRGAGSLSALSRRPCLNSVQKLGPRSYRAGALTKPAQSGGWRRIVVPVLIVPAALARFGSLREVRS